MSSEIERHARATYHMNFGEWPRGNVRQIRDEDIPEHDLLCGGWPCQPFSLAGKREGFADETRGTLFFEIVRILRARRPLAVFLENVPNLARHDEGRTLATVLRVLGECGYDVHWKVLDACRYGVPTARKRIYIACFRADLGVGGFSFPAPTDEPVRLCDVLVPAWMSDHLAIRESDFRIEETAAAVSGSAPRPIPLKAVVRGRRTGQGYRVYDASGVAITLCAGSGGLGSKTGLYRIGRIVRRLHPRECLRVMGYPDDFTIPPAVPAERFLSLVGNSVVVPLVRLIGVRMLEALRSRPGVTPLIRE
jgi:DNA (cytosine-5)-methyltransferase 1